MACYFETVMHYDHKLANMTMKIANDADADSAVSAIHDMSYYSRPNTFQLELTFLLTDFADIHK